MAKERDKPGRDRIRQKLRARHLERGPPKGLWTPEIVKQRIQIGVLLDRLHKQAVAPRSRQLMTGLSVEAAQYLVSLLVPKAEAPKDADSGQSVNFYFDDPTQRPPGYARKPG